ncbi:MAG: hypothetical protein J5649_05130 [Lachnospiraceae bacterium]|nr:hypothetical protein [Lachnospiraceae bacterium]
MKRRLTDNRRTVLTLAVVILGAVLLFSAVLKKADAVKQQQSQTQPQLPALSQAQSPKQTETQARRDPETDGAAPTQYPRVNPKDPELGKKYEYTKSDLEMLAARLPSIRVDGQVEEDWNVCETYELQNPVYGDNGASAEFRAFCDEEILYLLIEVKDTTKQLTGEAPTRCDSVEVYLNEDGEKPERYHAGDSHYIFMRNGEIEERSGADARLVERVVTETDYGYMIELSILWSLSPEDRNETFGLDIRINDSQTPGTRDYIVQWSDTSMMTHENLTRVGTMTIR